MTTLLNVILPGASLALIAALVRRAVQAERPRPPDLPDPGCGEVREAACEPPVHMWPASDDPGWLTQCCHVDLFAIPLGELVVRSPSRATCNPGPWEAKP